jgi:hypothetical protein
MHATFRQDGSVAPGRPMRGTFYPSDGPQAGTSMASALPKLLAILVAIAVIRNVVGGAQRHRDGGSRWSRRREAIAEFHRELHAQDAATGPADPAVKA